MYRRTDERIRTRKGVQIRTDGFGHRRVCPDADGRIRTRKGMSGFESPPAPTHPPPLLAACCDLPIKAPFCPASKTAPGTLNTDEIHDLLNGIFNIAYL